MINEQLIVDLRQYIISKTGKTYFGRIKDTPNNIMVSCPFHKEGQERKPSCGIKKETDDKGIAGTVHCFSCKETSDLSATIKEILGDLYNEDEVESRFNLSALNNEIFIQEKKIDLFKIPTTKIITETTLRSYREYHPYLEQRRITKEVTEIYDLGFDKYNNQITFPIRNIYKECIGVGRRSILHKSYIYPSGMVKPLYGVYELSNYINYLFIVEGPFNLWSLKGWGKQGVALLGTGTEHQYQELLKINCKGYVLALDPDDAGRNGTIKIANFLKQNRKQNIYVLLLPNGKDVNDLTQEEFRTIPVVTYQEWRYLYGIK